MNKYLKLFLSVFFSILILFLLFRKFDILMLNEILKISPHIILFAFLAFFFIKLVNTFRYSKLYNIKPNIKLFSLLSFSNMMLSILPFRAGELSYIKELKKGYNKSYLEGTKNLIILRFLDYVVIFILFLFSSFYVAVNIKSNFVKILSLFFIFFIFVDSLFWYIIKFRKERFKINNKKLKKIIKIFNEGSKNISQISKGKIAILSLFTVLYWLLRLTMGYLILLMLGVNLSFFTVIFISLLMLLVGLLPIRTLGNFGIFEGGWTYFLVILGFSYNEILPLILQYHIILLIPVIIFGIIGYLSLKSEKIR